MSKTAKEIATLCAITNRNYPVGKNSVLFSPEEFENFCKQLCKEQRELCQSELGKGNPKVRNAPKPKFN